MSKNTEINNSIPSSNNSSTVKSLKEKDYCEETKVHDNSNENLETIKETEEVNSPVQVLEKKKK
jgi:hypothetical protein